MTDLLPSSQSAHSLTSEPSAERNGTTHLHTGHSSLPVSREFMLLINHPGFVDLLFKKASKVLNALSPPLSSSDEWHIEDISHLGFSVAESMAMFYNCVNRISIATGNITKETVTLEMMGHVVHESFPVDEVRNGPRTPAEAEILEQCWPIKNAIGRFFCSTVPEVPLWQYIIRLQRHLKLSSYTFLVAILLMRRAMKAPSKAVLESLYQLELNAKCGAVKEEEKKDSESGSASGSGSGGSSGGDSPEAEHSPKMSPSSPLLTAWTQNPAFDYIHLITVRSQHRLTLTVLRVASKMVEDMIVNNAGCAGISGVSVRALVQLERTLCVLLDFELGYLGSVVVREALNMRDLVIWSEMGRMVVSGGGTGRTSCDENKNQERERGREDSEGSAAKVDSPQEQYLARKEFEGESDGVPSEGSGHSDGRSDGDWSG